MSGDKPDGIDVAIAAFLGARLAGRTTEEATRQAEAMLGLFGVERKDSTPPLTSGASDDQQ